MDYVNWNELIARHFFRTEAAGRNVYLYVTSELLEQLGQPAGQRRDDFVRAVIAGPPWATANGLCQRAFQVCQGWRERGFELPPYIGYLALFVLAAGLDGDFAPHAYYPRLRTLLGEPPTVGQLPFFHFMRYLWDDLETWSQDDRKGELGIFSVTLASKMPHVGIPMAQTLLAEDELHALPLIFARAGMDPTAPLSSEALASSLRRFGSSHFRHRTLGLLEAATKDYSELHEALLQIIQDEMLAWDGTVETEVTEGDDGFPVGDRISATPRPLEHQERPVPQAGVRTASTTYSQLRFRCELNRVARSMLVFVHSKSARSMPETGLIVRRLHGGNAAYRCDDGTSGWSTPLRHADSATSVTGAEFDWRAGVELVDPLAHWHLRLVGSPVRLFVSGSALRMHGLVEERRLPTESHFYIAAAEEACGLVMRWGAASCVGFQEVPISTGLPRGWRFFEADRVIDDAMVRQAYPILSLPRSTKIYLDGGIRALGANQYFVFAPPRISIVAPPGNHQVMCNGVPLTNAAAGGTYALPEDSPSGVRLVIEVWAGDELQARRSLYLAEHGWPSRVTAYRLTRWGALLSNAQTAEPSFRGAQTDSVVAAPFVALPSIDFGSVGQATLLGSKPGQVAHWPTEPLPTSWAPVWAVVHRKRGQAFFCGLDLSRSELSDGDTGSRRLVREWKELIWVRRKKIRPPADRGELALWKRYQERARNA
jgi:hypothetical protein